MFLLPIVYLFFSFWDDKELRYEDFTYEDNIKTARLYPLTDNQLGKMASPVISVNSNSLLLEFDDLQPDRNNYYVKIYSCDYNWEKSRLHDLDFLHEYNEFNILDFAYSNNRSMAYVHYKFSVPPVKISGNYLLVVYRDGDLSDLVLTKRFMVSSNKISVHQNSNLGINTLRSTNQQFNFILKYDGLDIPNPIESVNVVIRQNQRWDNAQRDFKPSFINEGSKTLEYRLFNTDKGFQAGNEFRFVDFRSVNSPGQNVGRLQYNNNEFFLDVALDGERTTQRYAQFQDLNGNYVVENIDSGNGDLSGNYLNVKFTLLSPKPYNSKVYVMGAFNGWIKTEANEMKFRQGQYTCEMILKQGFYNYAYINEDDSENIEGNHYETENFYEVFVYNHTYFPDADQLVGYYSFVVNKR